VALAPAAVLAVVFIASLPADPVMGFTGSTSPFADEGVNVMNACYRWVDDWWCVYHLP
jgi:LmbE family N-acetylglucosaminyl deacetylase